LSQQDYKGKRVHIIISDGNRQVTTKLDIGVQADLTIAQVDYYFDVSGNEESVCLLGNTKEQIFGEKLVSLLKWGVASTRFKDIHDFYYLGHEEGFDKAKLDAYLEKWVYSSDLSAGFRFGAVCHQTVHEREQHRPRKAARLCGYAQNPRHRKAIHGDTHLMDKDRFPIDNPCRIKDWTNNVAKSKPAQLTLLVS
jgi:hypothetical protein